MRKVIIVFILGLLCLNAISQNPNSFHGVCVNLQVCLVDPYKGGPLTPKSPLEPPTVSIDDHTLYIYDVDYGFTLYLLDEDDNVVYSTFVAANATSVNLPATLTGDYVLQLIPGGDYYFEGEIEL